MPVQTELVENCIRPPSDRYDVAADVQNPTGLHYPNSTTAIAKLQVNVITRLKDSFTTIKLKKNGISNAQTDDLQRSSGSEQILDKPVVARRRRRVDHGDGVKRFAAKTGVGGKTRFGIRPSF
jgi:hypothetical protein